MPAMEVGRVCIKTRGREAGAKVVIVETGAGKENEFVTIDGKGVKRRRCNIRHLMPTNDTVNVSKGAKHEDIVKALE